MYAGYTEQQEAIEDRKARITATLPADVAQKWNAIARAKAEAEASTGGEA